MNKHTVQVAPALPKSANLSKSARLSGTERVRFLYKVCNAKPQIRNSEYWNLHSTSWSRI